MRDFEPASLIMEYVWGERERIFELAKLIPDEPDFLLYCINEPVYPDEVDAARVAFADIQDLM